MLKRKNERVQRILDLVAKILAIAIQIAELISKLRH